MKVPILKTVPYLCSVLLLAFLFSSCSSTQLASTWKDSAHQGEPYSKILVIGVAEEEANRRMFEGELVNQLQARGTNAVPSFSILPPGTEISKETIAPKIKDSKIDAVLVTRLVKVDEKTHRTPGQTYVVPRVYYNHFYGYYRRVYHEVHTPGYLTKEVVVNLETNLYDVETEGLVWTALSKTLDPQSASQVIKSVSTAITGGLQKDDFIAH